MYGIGLNTMHKINKIDAALKQKAMYDPCLKKSSVMRWKRCDERKNMKSLKNKLTS